MLTREDIQLFENYLKDVIKREYPLIAQYESASNALLPGYKEEKAFNAINPAYLDIEHVKLEDRLRLNEKRIWVLRADMILATGIKNAYRGYLTYPHLRTKIDPTVHEHVNWNSRSGHPSLAELDGENKGKAYYAGHVCQRERNLEVLVQSGRYIDDLDLVQKRNIEIYIALQFRRAYGKQDIIFYEAATIDSSRDNLNKFLEDAPYSPGHTYKRAYTHHMILKAALEYKQIREHFSKVSSTSHFSVSPPITTTMPEKKHTYTPIRITTTTPITTMHHTPSVLSEYGPDLPSDIKKIHVRHCIEGLLEQEKKILPKKSELLEKCIQLLSSPYRSYETVLKYVVFILAQKEPGLSLFKKNHLEIFAKLLKSHGFDIKTAKDLLEYAKPDPTFFNSRFIINLTDLDRTISALLEADQSLANPAKKGPR